MPSFKFVAYDSAGVKRTDDIEAESLDLAKAKLVADGLLVSQITEKKQNSAFSFALTKPKVSLDDLEFLTSELSLLLQSGVKIDKALSILNRNSSSPAMGKLVNDILSQLKKGKSLSDAFAETKGVFDPLYLNLIRIGETTGQLAEVFEGLSSDLKFRRDLRAKIIQAITYPAVILFVCILCIVFVFNYIVPQMGSIFTESDDIPVYTAFLLAASDWMINYQWFLLLAIVGAGGFIYSAKDNPDIAYRMANIALSMPVVSKLTIQTERIRFSSAMALMLDAGVKLDNAIGYAANSIKNRIIGKSMQVAKDKIKKGSPITSALSGTPIYTDFYLSLLEVGEESGRMQEVFAEIARRSKSEFEDWTTRVTSLLEPLLILVMGGIVGSVVVTMLLSVVSVNDVGL